MPADSMDNLENQSNCENVERWKDIPGFSFYQVSDLGHVRSRKPHARSQTPRLEWLILKPHRMKNGYLVVYLSAGSRKERAAKLIHRLVLESFVGPCPENMEARHVNDNQRDNNRLDNLRWGTKSENQADRLRHGTDHCGSKHFATRLTEEDVVVMRRLWKDGFPLHEIARRFKQRRENVWKICHGETWRHVPEQEAG